jgi:hypothetical protein
LAPLTRDDILERWPIAVSVYPAIYAIWRGREVTGTAAGEIA